MNKVQILQIIDDSVGEPLEREVERKNYRKWLDRHLKNDLIKAITGFRRSGKSFLLKQLYRDLTEKGGVPKENIFFVNFEHTQLVDKRTVKDLNSMFEIFLQDCSDKHRIYLFLDEVQNVKGWESFVRTLYEKDKERHNFFITGSNSSLLSSEFSSSLSGRVVELNIMPFSFEESLAFHGIQVSSERDYVDNKGDVDRLLERYVSYGGMPEVVGADIETVKDYMNGVFQKVLLDDIVKRFKIEKVEVIEKLFYFLITNTGSVTSLLSVAKQIEKQSFKATIPTLESYVSYYDKAYAMSKIPRFSWKSKAVFRRLYKYYPIDTSFITFFSLNQKELKSKALEGSVFLRLKGMGKQVYYGRDTSTGKEIDFIVDEGGSSYLKVQVCWELNDDNKKREIGNFKLADKYLSKGGNYIVTMGSTPDSHVLKGGVKVEEIPLWYFLLRM